MPEQEKRQTNKTEYIPLEHDGEGNFFQSTSITNVSTTPVVYSGQWSLTRTFQLNTHASNPELLDSSTVVRLTNLTRQLSQGEKLYTPYFISQLDKLDLIELLTVLNQKGNVNLNEVIARFNPTRYLTENIDTFEHLNQENKLLMESNARPSPLNPFKTIRGESAYSYPMIGMTIIAIILEKLNRQLFTDTLSVKFDDYLAVENSFIDELNLRNDQKSQFRGKLRNELKKILDRKNLETIQSIFSISDNQVDTLVNGVLSYIITIENTSYREIEKFKESMYITELFTPENMFKNQVIADLSPHNIVLIARAYITYIANLPELIKEMRFGASITKDQLFNNYKAFEKFLLQAYIRVIKGVDANIDVSNIENLKSLANVVDNDTRLHFLLGEFNEVYNIMVSFTELINDCAQNPEAWRTEKSKDNLDERLTANQYLEALKTAGASGAGKNRHWRSYRVKNRDGGFMN